jgi:glucose-6-phosphate 1-dehydrogenase
MQHGFLDVPVIAVAKSNWSLDDLKKRAQDSLKEFGGGIDPAAFAKLSGLLHYVDGDYRDETTFTRLRQELGSASHPTHYLAIPPSLFDDVVSALGRSGCADGARVIVEKPFGHNSATARQLNAAIHKVFPESAVFRIDHYLGKRALRISCTSDSTTLSSSQSGTATTSSVCRSPWPKISALPDAESFTTKRVPSAT